MYKGQSYNLCGPLLSPVPVPDHPPERCSNESEPEVRKSRAAVIAPEPLTVDLEITEARVKKTIRYPNHSQGLTYMGHKHMYRI